MSEKSIGGDAGKFLRKNAWLVTALVAGIILLLLPSSGKAESAPSDGICTEFESRLSGALSRMEGVGEVYVLLSENPGRGGGFAGAVVVCTGAGDPGVRLRVTQTVAAFTGLGANKIVIQKMRS